MAKKKILVVDDEPNIARVVQKRLESMGYDVMIANNGETGLQKAHKEKPDLILLDVLMPGMSGIEVCQKLKADAATKKIPVVVFTATGNEDVQKEIEAAGAVATINKPFLAEIREVIAQVFEECESES